MPRVTQRGWSRTSSDPSRPAPEPTHWTAVPHWALSTHESLWTTVVPQSLLSPLMFKNHLLISSAVFSGTNTIFICDLLFLESIRFSWSSPLCSCQLSFSHSLSRLLSFTHFPGRSLASIFFVFLCYSSSLHHSSSTFFPMFRISWWMFISLVDTVLLG